MSTPPCRCGHHRSAHAVKCRGCVALIESEGVSRPICEQFDEMYCTCFHRAASHSEVIGEGCRVTDCRCATLTPLTLEHELIEYERQIDQREKRRGYLRSLLDVQHELDCARR